MNGVRSWFRPGKSGDTVAVDATELADLRGQVNAIGRSQALIEFALDGTILTANDNFLNAVGYMLRVADSPWWRVKCAISRGARRPLRRRSRR
jgi:hypothetical protein